MGFAEVYLFNNLKEKVLNLCEVCKAHNVNVAEVGHILRNCPNQQTGPSGGSK